MEQAAKRLTGHGPQTEPVPGRENEMMQGYSGGHRFKSSWQRDLWRWLLLGNTGNTFYASGDQLNYDALKDVFFGDAEDQELLDILLRARDVVPRPKNVVGAYALATVLMRCAVPQLDSPVDWYGVNGSVFNAIVRNGSDLLYFFKIRKAAGGGFGSGLRNAVCHYYAQRHAPEYDAVKYKQRWGNWTQRDVLRLVHPKPQLFSPRVAATFAYILGKEPDLSDESVKAAYEASAIGFEKAVQAAETIGEVVDAIGRYQHTMWEAIPTQWLTKKEVWQALIEARALGDRAFLRNLGRFARHQFLLDPEFRALLAKRITRFQASRISPMLVFLGAAGLYDADTEPTAKGEVLAHLNDLFVKTMGVGDFPAVKEGTYYIAVDSSASMQYRPHGSKLPVSVYSQALAIASVLARAVEKSGGRAVSLFVDTEVRTPAYGFEHRSLEGVFADGEARGGGTYLNRLIDHIELAPAPDTAGIVLVTDNESYGDEHYYQAVNRLRKKLNKPGLGSVTVDIAPYGGQLADPKNPRDLAITGFSPDLPAIIAQHLSNA